MKTWNQLLIGDKVIARASVDDKPSVIIGSIVEVPDGDSPFGETISIIWEVIGEGNCTYVYRENDFSGFIHCYESESERLAITLKLL